MFVNTNIDIKQLERRNNKEQMKHEHLLLYKVT